MTVFQAKVRVASDIILFLQNNQRGEVLLSTSKGLYLQISSKVLLITDWSFGVTPIGIGLSQFVDFVTEIKPQPGQYVQVQNGDLIFPGGILTATWEVVSPVTITGQLKREQIVRCSEILLAQCSARSAARLVAPLLLKQDTLSTDPLFSRAHRSLERLIAGLTCGSEEAISESVGDLLGLGLGLTPSMDDVLLGMLYGFLRFAPQEAVTAVLRDVILEKAPTQTNEISAAYLCAVAKGGHFERLENVLTSLYTDGIIEIGSLLEIGSSSGSEMLLGLLLAADITTKG